MQSRQIGDAARRILAVTVGKAGASNGVETKMRIRLTGLLLVVAAAGLYASDNRSAGAGNGPAASQTVSSMSPARKRGWLCRWVRRAAGAEPRLAERLSSWGISADTAQPQTTHPARVAAREQAPNKHGHKVLAELQQEER